MKQNIDGFLKNAKGDRRGCNEEMLMLALDSEKSGKYPCQKCEEMGNCSKRMCIAWYCWFKKHWSDIRKAGEAMK